jgi:hypothetical protein
MNCLWDFLGSFRNLARNGVQKGRFIFIVIRNRYAISAHMISGTFVHRDF